jgi:hypothetical protein
VIILVRSVVLFARHLIFGLEFGSLAAYVDVSFSTVRSRNRVVQEHETAKVAHLAGVNAGPAMNYSVPAV